MPNNKEYMPGDYFKVKIDEPKIEEHKVKPRKSRAAMSIKKGYNLVNMNNQLMQILRREIYQLLQESYSGPLKADRSKALVQYLDLVRELQAAKLLEEIESKVKDDKANEVSVPKS